MDASSRAKIIRTWDKEFHLNIRKRGNAYNQNRKPGTRRFTDGVISSFNFFAAKLDEQLGDMSPEVLAQLMSGAYDTLPVNINRNQAARCEWNSIEINAMKYRMDSMVEIGMVESYSVRFITGGRAIYRLQMSKEWLSIKLPADNTLAKGNTPPKSTKDPIGPAENAPTDPKNGSIDNQPIKEEESRSLNCIYSSLKKINNIDHNKEQSGENKFSTENHGNFTSEIGTEKRNKKGTGKISDFLPKLPKDFSPEKKKILLKPSPPSPASIKLGWYNRCVANLWLKAKKTIFKNLKFTRIQDAAYIEALKIHMDALKLKSNQDALSISPPTSTEIYQILEQAISAAYLYQLRSGYKYWPDSFLSMDVDLLNGESRNKTVSLQQITYHWLPNIWRKNKEKQQKKTQKWREQRIRLYINEVAERLLLFADKQGYPTDYLNQKKSQYRRTVKKKLHNSNLDHDSQNYLLKMYDTRTATITEI